MHKNSLNNLLRGRKDPLVCCIFCKKEFKKPFIIRHSKTCTQNPAFGTPCPKCGVLKHPEQKTCSTSCYNSFFRKGTCNPNYQGNNYRTICFAYHKKECCLCGFNLIIEVHHLNGNNKDNSPLNLIPLCPNHHRIWHSRHRALIEEKVLKYVNSFGASPNLVMAPVLGTGIISVQI